MHDDEFAAEHVLDFKKRLIARGRLGIALIERAAKLLNIQSRFTGNSGRLRYNWVGHQSNDTCVGTVSAQIS